MVNPMTTPLILSRPPLRDFLEIPYDELEELNLDAKDARIKRRNPEKVQEERMKYLQDEKRIKAVTVCFTVAAASLVWPSEICFEASAKVGATRAR